ncbi:MAG: hypothetical protein HQ538_00200 [Parcubacteria group bacterium]|nr:hypothetical protein [Parcubacteria group bacterium]
MKKKLIPFLKKVILENQNDYIVVASGWRGEAEWLKDFLVDRGIPLEKIYLEREACITSENISFVFSRLFTKNEGWPNFNKINEILFVGEKGSEKEVLWLAPKIYLRITGSEKMPKIEFFPLELMNYEDRKKKEKKLIFNKIAFYFPVFHTLMRILRQNDII